MRLKRWAGCAPNRELIDGSDEIAKPRHDIGAPLATLKQAEMAHAGSEWWVVG
jgi:hypothetical protein